MRVKNVYLIVIIVLSSSLLFSDVIENFIEDLQYYINDNDVRFRSAPDLDSTILGKLNINETVIPLERSKDPFTLDSYGTNYWYKCRIPNKNNQEAWIYGGLLSFRLRKKNENTIYLSNLYKSYNGNLLLVIDKKLCEGRKWVTSDDLEIFVPGSSLVFKDGDMFEGQALEILTSKMVCDENLQQLQCEIKTKNDNIDFIHTIFGDETIFLQICGKSVSTIQNFSPQIQDEEIRNYIKNVGYDIYRERLKNEVGQELLIEQKTEFITYAPTYKNDNLVNGNIYYYYITHTNNIDSDMLRFNGLVKLVHGDNIFIQPPPEKIRFLKTGTYSKSGWDMQIFRSFKITEYDVPFIVTLYRGYESISLGLQVSNGLWTEGICFTDELY